MFFAFLGAAPYLIVETMGMAKVSYGLWFISLSCGYMIGNFCSGRFSERQGGQRMMLIGNVLGTIGIGLFLALATVPVLHPAAIFLPCFLMSVGNGFLLPNAIAAPSASIRRRPAQHRASSDSCRWASAPVASYVAGQVTTVSPLPMAMMMFALTLAAWAAISWGPAHERRASSRSRRGGRAAALRNDGPQLLGRRRSGHRAVIDPRHPLHGETVSGAVRRSRAGAAPCTASSVLLELIHAAKAPAALIFREEEQILTFGALAGEAIFGATLPVAQVPDEAFAALAGGSRVRVDASGIATDHGVRIAFAQNRTARIALSATDEAMLVPGRRAKRGALPCASSCGSPRPSARRR